MKFTFGIFLSLLAFESIVAAPAPAPPSGPIVDSPSPSPSGRTKNCKAPRRPPGEWAQGFGRHRRPGSRPSAVSHSTEVPAPSPSSGSDGSESSAHVSEAAPSPSEIASAAPSAIASPFPSKVEEPSSTQETVIASPTAIQAGQTGEVQDGGDAGGGGGGNQDNNGDNGGEQNPGQASSATANPPITTGDSGGDSGGNGEAGASAGFEADILNAHNVFRATYGAQPLVWNQTLADQGNNYWRDRNCEFAHSNLGNGENLTGGGGKFTGQGVLDGWAGEAGKWSPGKGFTMETGHFTQVVWKETTSLGCGLFVCGAQSLAFCEYQKPGNAGGGAEFDQQVVKS